MMNLFRAIWEAIRSLFALVFPMFDRARSAAADAANPVGRWLARIVVVALVLLLFWLINQSETVGLKYWITYPHELSELWLPVFALCVYAMLWLGWWLYRVLSLEIEPIGSEFPDIDSAWSQAVEALRKAEIHLDSSPLFLVLGWNSGTDESLFQASGMRLLVKQAPRDPNMPLHVTANRDGIWITCEGASALGQHDPAVGGEAPDATLSSLIDDGGDPNRTNAFAGGGGGATLRIEDLVQGGLAKILEKQKSRVARKAVDPALYKARLQHLCRLILRDRQGLCPVNGVMVLLPITVADPKAGVQEIASSCRADLELALETFRIRCPILFLVCDLEKLTGFGELVDRLPKERLSNRMGQRFPLVPDLNPGDFPGKVQSSVEWISDTLFPSMVHSLCHVETPGGEDVGDVVRANSQLFRFLTSMRERQERLTQLVKDCIPSMPGEPVLFGGCYFAGTGEADVERAFASGVFARMIQDQDRVTWTSDYMDDDASYLRMARLCRTFLIAFIALGSLLAAILIVVILLRGGGGGGGAGPDAA
jgi:hypothetical protein